MTDSYHTLNEYHRRSSSVLLLTPSHEPPDDSACIDLLTRDPPGETNVLSATFSASPAERLSLWKREAGDELPKRATIVDARRNVADAQLPASEAASLSVREIPENADLYDVCLAIASQLGAWKNTDETTVACLHSVSTLLAAYETDRVLGLITGLNALCERLDVTAHHHADPSTLDEETLATLRPLYDTVIEYTPDGGWIPTEREATATEPSFRSTTAPPGGAAKTDPRRPETVPMRYSFDTILNLLSSPRRRTLLYNLKNQPTPEVPIDRLVEEIHDIERGVPVRDASPREDTRIELLHEHLPKLQEAGIARYDDDSETVHYSPNRGLESFLRYVETVELG